VFQSDSTRTPELITSVCSSGYSSWTSLPHHRFVLEAPPTPAQYTYISAVELQPCVCGSPAPESEGRAWHLISVSYSGQKMVCRKRECTVTEMWATYYVCTCTVCAQHHPKPPVLRPRSSTENPYVRLTRQRSCNELSSIFVRRGGFHGTAGLCLASYRVLPLCAIGSCPGAHSLPNPTRHAPLLRRSIEDKSHALLRQQHKYHSRKRARNPCAAAV
jgi:hypothetical protein